jgi:D-amino peptidase
MKVFLSTDIEGTAGIADWGQVVGEGAKYESGRRLLLDEVNAAIDGALDAGATELVVNDSHWTMQNLPAADLHGRASLVSGKHKPLYMMQGLDETFDAIFLVSYHGAISAEHAVLSHTYNPFAFHEVRLNGTCVGEAAINALVALAHRVPVALITGDAATADEARPFMPGVEAVVVKDSITRFAAHSVHPQVACELIRDGARRALERLSTLDPPAIEIPARLEITFLTADMAEIATWIRGVERTGTRTARVVDEDPLRLYRTFVTIVVLTGTLVESLPA